MSPRLKVFLSSTSIDLTPHRAKVREIVDRLSQASVCMETFGARPTSPLEVAHEALLREWPRLAGWIRERADDLRLVRQAEAAALEWERHQRAPHYGWPQERLTPVCESRDRLGLRHDLRDPLRSFVRPEWEWLVLEIESPTTTYQRRVAVGDRLDQLGDPRPGVGVTSDSTPDIVWCKIPGGVVDLEDGVGRFEVTPFYIAKYPITFGQYRAFIDDANGYQDARHWQALQHESEPGEQYRRFGNCPAENVSWHDATAICRWLSGRLGFEVGLPSEQEWQQAATGGGPQNVYPWGSQWEAGHANTAESRLGRTTAVGMHPQGVSAHGAMDLAGNVWEWCQNEYGDSGGQTRTKPIRRVLRGGSWYDDQDYAGATYRGDSDPDSRYHRIGFRVVCVSHPLIDGSLRRWALAH